MFAVFCPFHRTRVLLSERRIRAVHNTADGIVIEVECHDGARIRLVTGRPVDPDVPPAERIRRARRAVAATSRG